MGNQMSRKVTLVEGAENNPVVAEQMQVAVSPGKRYPTDLSKLLTRLVNEVSDLKARVKELESGVEESPTEEEPSSEE